MTCCPYVARYRIQSASQCTCLAANGAVRSIVAMIRPALFLCTGRSNSQNKPPTLLGNFVISCRSASPEW